MRRYVVYSLQKKGSLNNQVKAIQESLPNWSSSNYLKVDGAFGSATDSAVKTFQESIGVPTDGVVGEITGTALGVWRTIEQGFDISQWNTIDFDRIGSEYTFCNIKATEGFTYTDPKWESNAASALQLGLTLGAYHFTKFANPPFLEASNFLNAVSKFNPQYLYLDLEYRKSGLSALSIWTWVESFLQTIKDVIPDSKIGMYTSQNYLSEIGLQKYTKLANYGLWAANWSEQPYVYPFKNWETWQWTSKGEVSWSNGEYIDLNYRV